MTPHALPYVAAVAAMAVALVGCATAPSGPFPRQSLQDRNARRTLAYRCQAQAIWPAHQSADYRNAGARRRSQIDNDPGPEVETMRTLCWQLSRATETNSVSLMAQCNDKLAEVSRRYGEKAAAYVRSQRTICQTLTGQASTS